MRADWHKLGDKNTNYFQLNAMVRRKQNEINKVRDTNGIWWSKGEGLEQVFVQDFKLQFTCSEAPSPQMLE